MPKERIVASLDIGSAKIRTVVAVVDGEQEKLIPNVIGVGISPSHGMRKGHVIDVEELIHNIISSLEDAERMAGVPINHVFVGMSGSHIESFDSRGVIAISGSEISVEDVGRVLEAAQAVSIPQNRRILHIEPKSYAVDEQRGIKNPVGMTGIRLEVEAHIVTGHIQHVKNIEKCVDQAGVDIDDIVPATVAAPEAVLTKRQKELGVVIIDIGAGCTSVAVFEEGTILYSASLPLGGESVTNDIAIGLRTSIDTAEKIKIEFGSVLPQEIAEREMIDLSSVSKVDTQTVSKRYMAEIMQARYFEVFSLVKQELTRIGRSGMLPAGALLTGAASKAPGVLDLARDVLGLPVQMGFPVDVGGVIEKVDDPAYATALGTLIWGVREGESAPMVGTVQMKRAVQRMGSWFKSLLP
ncbi:MAG: cell division protein FtsA [Candidatus Peribacter riflensis]|uniref:Cell division protein FtsA n=1 Tax=Candidatus Peribacter riflensis TaxID=1735162 RepID=A0A0S1SKK2_9BACT|nr:MAG: cell division protein FtsA [Candidatus Peribacter riflensis]OGJ77116.1 MAG: cell division protein FtsA [Candidatus Peribacteria bacterium RIFOXYB1_FULL_57_12]OGJ79048.1 MAG: cell division protein FtsA [Candidatus Peribacteria bacterium RIFOXYC1_FULL_58_8]ALM11062.1 MAG: cell division protein FtsA [Candidatus Peribacter riflensis]ALM12165.1 MAG: cell division protein FtsA [Candidatus Peribacter riflensis]